MAALAADLEAVRVAVQETVKTRGKKWKDTTWSNFIKDVVSFLLGEGRDQDDTAAAAVGLILYGVTSEKELQGVGQGDYAEFKRQLAEEGVPKSICDLLFAQYVRVAIKAVEIEAVEIGAAPGGPLALEIGAVEATHSAVRARDQAALLHACQALNDLAGLATSTDAGGYKATILMDEGAHVALVAATREAIRAQHGDALRYACSALVYLASPRREQALVQAGAVEALVAATREAIRARHANALRYACKALGNLGCHSPERAQALVQAGAVEALVAATREAIRAQHGDALHEACYALSILAREGPERAQALVQAGAVEALVAATREAIRAQHADALRQPCKALWRLADKSPERAQALWQAGAVEALVAATREATRAQHGDALCFACSALSTLAYKHHSPLEEAQETAQEAAQALAQAGALEALVAATHEAIRAQHTAGLAAAVVGLAKIVSSSGSLASGPRPEFRVALEEAGVVNALIAAARYPANDVRSLPCNILYKLGMWSPEVSARVRREGLAGRVWAASGEPWWLPGACLLGWRCIW
jgi:hypothetical protein